MSKICTDTVLNTHESQSYSIYHTVGYLDLSGVCRPPGISQSVKGSHDPGLIQWLFTLQHHLLLDPLEREGGECDVSRHSSSPDESGTGLEVEAEIWGFLGFLWEESEGSRGTLYSTLFNCGMEGEYLDMSCQGL